MTALTKMSNEENPQNENLNPTDAAQASEEVAQHETENVVNLDGMNGEPDLNLNPAALIDSMQAELVAAKDRTMRALADAENTRRRAQKDREDAGKYAISGFARDLLDFGDNFKRALDALPEDAPQSVRDGLEAMERELLATFERHGIKKIEPMGEMFDANYHEVMFEMPADKPVGTICQVIEAGYVLNDRLLRAAKVGIAKANPDAPSGAKIDIQG